MSRCRHGLSSDCPACDDLGEQRAAGEHLDPVTERDFDRLEQGPWWSSYPGQGSA